MNKCPEVWPKGMVTSTWKVGIPEILVSLSKISVSKVSVFVGPTNPLPETTFNPSPIGNCRYSLSLAGQVSSTLHPPILSCISTWSAGFMFPSYK